MGLLEYIYRYFQEYIEQNIPEIKSIDLYFDQFNSDTIDLASPRVLIEIGLIEPQTDLGGIQVMECSAILHVGININDTFNSNSKGLDKNLSFLKLLDKVYTSLQTTDDVPLLDDAANPDDLYRISNMRRSGILLSTDGDDMTKVSQITFNFKIDDMSAANSYYDKGIIDGYELNII